MLSLPRPRGGFLDVHVTTLAAALMPSINQVVELAPKPGGSSPPWRPAEIVARSCTRFTVTDFVGNRAAGLVERLLQAVRRARGRRGSPSWRRHRLHGACRSRTRLAWSRRCERFASDLDPCARPTRSGKTSVASGDLFLQLRAPSGIEGVAVSDLGRRRSGSPPQRREDRARC